MRTVTDCVADAVTRWADTHPDVTGDPGRAVAGARTLAMPVTNDATGMPADPTTLHPADPDDLTDTLHRLLCTDTTGRGFSGWAGRPDRPSLPAGDRRIVAARTADVAVSVTVWTP